MIGAGERWSAAISHTDDVGFIGNLKEDEV